MSWSKYVLFAIAAVAAGLVFAASNLDPSLPGISQTPEGTVSSGVPVVQTTLAGAERVEVTIGFSAPVVVDSGELAGRVTMLPVQPGDLIRCGDPVIQVDGIDRPLFCSDVPLFRSLGSTETGTDVAALHAFLVSMGIDLSDPASESVNAETRRAIRAYREQFGLPRSQTFDPSFVVYSPGPIKVGEVNIRIGERIDPEQTILTTEQDVVKADFGFDTALADQRYVVNLADSDFDVILDTRTGSITDLARLGTTIDPDRNFDEDPLTGELRLADELDVMSVPTSSVVSDGNTVCVMDEDSGVAVGIVIVDSRAGSTFFLPEPDLVAARVLVNPFNAAQQC